MSDMDKFRYLEVCPAVTQRRGTIVDLHKDYGERVKTYLRPDRGSAYRSLFLYDGTYPEYARLHGDSVRGYTGTVWARDAVADLDDNDSLDNALSAARAATARLVRDYAVSEAAVQVGFTGNRGFHIALPQSLIGFAPSQTLPAQMASFWRSILDGCLPETTKFDDSIYSFNKLIRVAGSYHEKTARYKTMLSWEELRSLGVSELLQLSGARRESPKYDHEPKVNELLQMVWKLACDREGRKYSHVGRSGALGGTAERTQAAINEHHRKNISELLSMPVKPGERNNTAFRIASDLFRHRHALAEVDALMMLWNRQLPEPLSDAELKQVIRSAERSRSN